MRFLRKGKVKEVYEVSKTELEFVFTDQISVFDKVIPTLVPHKGETLCRTSAHWFKLVESLGVRTHFLRVLDGNRMRVRRVQVIPDYDTITPKTKNFLIPLAISKLSPGEYDDLVKAVLKIDDRLNTEVRKRGLIHVDGKKEFAMDQERRLMLVDTFGTADEDRFWDLEAYQKGEQIELSKEFVRQYYRKIGYHQALMEAREAGGPEPDIPPLPEEVTKEVSDLYVALFERLTGEKFR